MKRLLKHAPTAVVAVAVAGVAFAYGGYDLTARGIVAIALWWAVILGLGLALLPFRRPTREAYVSGGLLSGLALLALLSLVWSTTPERSFIEFDRITLYLGLFILVVLAGTRANVGHWTNGLAIGIVAIGLLALTTRLFPGLIPGSDELSSIGNARARLAYPLGYWNGLGMFVALGFPLLLRVAAVGRATVARALAVAVLPALSATVFLTSSRGAIGAGVIGAAVLILLARPRSAALWAAFCGAAGSGLALVFLAGQPAFVNAPLRDPAATAAVGRVFAVVLLVLCVLAAALFVVGLLVARSRPDALPRPRLGRGVRVAAGAAAAVAVVAVVLAANPVGAFESFKQTGFRPGGQKENTTRLLTGSGGGRYQFWSAAVEQFRANPVLGDGAGSFEVWWAANPGLPYSVRDAHSLWFETLGELGLGGLVLLLGAFAYGLFTAMRRLAGRDGPERVTLAALAATVLAWAFAAAIDWMWEMTVVSAVAVVCLGLMTGPATAVRGDAPARERAPRARRGGRSFGLGVAVIAAAWLVICAQASPLLSQMRIEASRAALSRGDLDAALSAARGARTLQPWAGTPYRQLALVEEERGRFGPALGYIRNALDREPGNFELWQIAARIEGQAGQNGAARVSSERSRALNPKLSTGATVTP